VVADQPHLCRLLAIAVGQRRVHRGDERLLATEQAGDRVGLDDMVDHHQHEPPARSPPAHERRRAIPAQIVRVLHELDRESAFRHESPDLVSAVPDDGHHPFDPCAAEGPHGTLEQRHSRHAGERLRVAGQTETRPRRQDHAHRRAPSDVSHAPPLLVASETTCSGHLVGPRDAPASSTPVHDGDDLCTRVGVGLTSTSISRVEEKTV
jgi:hypothetical protein